MSWGTCYSGSNNIHFGYPPLMSDGRNFASWLPGDQINKEIRKDNGIKSNWEYRKYLTDNAENIMKQNTTSSCDQCCACPPVYGNNQQNNNGPYIFKSCTDNSTPFGYENSDLKQIYLNDTQLQYRLSAPIMTQYEYLEQGVQNYN
jgi:hypothetical protein